LEAKRWTFFDDLIILFGASPVLGDFTFFQTPVGSGTKTRFNTNFHGQGMLPSMNFYEIQEIGFAVYADLYSSTTTITIVNNAWIFLFECLKQGVFTLVTGGSKVEIDNIPVGKLGQGYGMTGVSLGGQNISPGAAAGGGVFSLNNGIPAEAGMYDLGGEPIVLTPLRSFAPVVSWPVGVPANSLNIPANTNFRAYLYFDGYLHRPA
jgi:hypothetical protein